MIPEQSNKPPGAPALEPYEQRIPGGPNGGGYEFGPIEVSAITAWNAAAIGSDQDDAQGCADCGGDRQLVWIATGYKPHREENPVDLSRLGAIELARAVLEALEDTFHYTRVGRLRPAEATELLVDLGDIEVALASLREHALGDLRDGAGLQEDIHS
jgi:hypothetical protein